MSPVETRQASKRKERSEISPDPDLEEADRVDEYATMYPAFCTEPIPVEILDELIEEGENGLHSIVDGGVPGHALCILDTKDLNSIVHGSRTPMQQFESPFIGMTDDQIRDWMKKNQHPSFANTFLVLDRHTIKNKTCRIGYENYSDRDGDKMLITDFWANMQVRVPIEVVEMSWWEFDELGTGKVYNRQYLEDEARRVYDAEV